MERAELIERPKGYEWDDLECKRAQRGIPESAYETVSAFSNTEGGQLVCGVQDKAGRLEIVGVIEVDKVQNDFLGVLRSAEIERLLRDAGDVPYDGATTDLDLERCFDGASVRWYRRLFDDHNLNHDPEQPDTAFLHDWGLVVEDNRRLAPTRAAILLFGSPAALRQLLPRPVVDWQWHRADWSGDFDEQRWTDRLVVESNLVEAWKTLRNRYLQRAEIPFSIDPETLQRADRPPDYAAFREAAINLLIHQDYAEQTRKAVIHSYADRTLLWNPGDAFASTEALLEPGEKEVRNPKIVAAFRRIGLSEQAGTGLRTIFGNQRQLGHVPPVTSNDRAGKAFQITLLKEELLSERRLLFQARLGVHLNEAESRAFAFACRESRLRPQDVRAVTGLAGAEAQAVLDRLTAQALISPLEGTETPVFVPAAHLDGLLDNSGGADDQSQPRQATPTTAQSEQPEDLSTAQPARQPGRLSTAQPAGPAPTSPTQQTEPPVAVSAVQEQIIRICDTPRRLGEVMAETGMTNRGHFKKRHLDPLLQSGVLRMTHPERRNHPRQAYVLTEVGVELKARRMSYVTKDDTPGNGDRPDGQ